MGDDAVGQKVRERVWVDKYDHTADPPRHVEQVFLQDGVVVGVLRCACPPGGAAGECPLHGGAEGRDACERLTGP